MKRILTLALCLLTGSILTDAQELKSPAKKPDYSSLAAKAITRAGANKAELAKALKLVPPAQKRALEFLIAYMPEKDLTSLRASFLLENVALAYRARETFPWAKKVPEEIFFNDILPYAALNERRDNWRKDFYNRFSKHVKDATTMEQAIKAVNAVIKDELKVEYNTKRKKPDQSPYESMDIHMASCTGLSILLNDAFRAVGIPSRVAGIPSWTTKRGNHNWVEVWTPSNQQWQFTEYYPDPKGLNHGWLVKDAAQANPKSIYHSIYASSWKPADSYFPLVWNLSDTSVNAKNVSDFYIKLGGGDKAATDLCELRIDFTNPAGIRTSIPVSLYQGDLKIASAKTPNATKDMNQFLVFSVKQGQIYQLIWKPQPNAKKQVIEIKPKKGSKYLRIPLPPQK